MKSTYTKLNVHGQRQNFVLGTQRNLYSTDLHLGFASGETQILGFALGVTQMLWLQDTNMLVSPTQISGVGSIAQRQTRRQGFCVAVEYRLKSIYHQNTNPCGWVGLHYFAHPPQFKDFTLTISSSLYSKPHRLNTSPKSVLLCLGSPTNARK